MGKVNPTRTPVEKQPALAAAASPPSHGCVWKGFPAVTPPSPCLVPAGKMLGATSPQAGHKNLSIPGRSLPLPVPNWECPGAGGRELAGRGAGPGGSTWIHLSLHGKQSPRCLLSPRCLKRNSSFHLSLTSCRFNGMGSCHALHAVSKICWENSGP